MYSEELQEKQREWAEQALMAARSLLPKMAPVSTYLGWQPRERQTVSFLLTATARASESAFLLCAYGQLWDAEVLVRSALEGSLKLAYLLQARETFAARHSEYADQLFEIALLKNHRKAAGLLTAVSNPDAPQWRPIRDLLLSDCEVAELSARNDKVARRSLETRWGFTGLIGSSRVPVIPISMVWARLHTVIQWRAMYSMSTWSVPRSHLSATGARSSVASQFTLRTRDVSCRTFSIFCSCAWVSATDL